VNKKQIILEFLQATKDEQWELLRDTNIEKVNVTIRASKNRRREQQKACALKSRNNPHHNDFKKVMSWFKINKKTGDVLGGTWNRNKFGVINSSGYDRTPKQDKGGYWNIVMKGKTYGIHRLIVMKDTGDFLKAGMEIHHINMDKSDNRISNLQITTPQENKDEWMKIKTRNA